MGESLGVDDPEGEVPGRAVRGRSLLRLKPPLSLRLSRPLLGSELGVARLVRGVPELLRRSSKSPAGDSAGEAALEGTYRIGWPFSVLFKDTLQACAGSGWRPYL